MIPSNERHSGQRYGERMTSGVKKKYHYQKMQSIQTSTLYPKTQRFYLLSLNNHETIRNYYCSTIYRYVYQSAILYEYGYRAAALWSVIDACSYYALYSLYSITMKIDPTLMYTITTKGNGVNYYMQITTRKKTGEERHEYEDTTVTHDILIPKNTTPYLAVKSGNAMIMVGGKREAIEATPLS